MQAEVSRRHVGRADAESDSHIVQLEEPLGHCLRVRGGHVEESLESADHEHGRRCKEKDNEKTNKQHARTEAKRSIRVPTT